MASAGKVSPVVKGAWNSAVSYTRLDIVSNATNTRSYIARKDSINVPLENTEYWQILADVADEATKVSYDNTTSKLTATKVQDAIDELADRKIDIDDTMSATSENPVQNKVIKKYADDIDNKYSQLSGRNLLLNSDFRVNQRGGKLVPPNVQLYQDPECLNPYSGSITMGYDLVVLDTYTSYGNYIRMIGEIPSGYVKASDVVDGYVRGSAAIYSVDRWRLDSGTLIYNNNSISLITATFRTKFEKIISNESYTVSIKVKNITSKLDLYVQNTNDYSGKTFKVDKVGISSFIFNPSDYGGINTVAMVCLDNCEIEWIKLEKGSIATPYEHPDYNEELRKCQRKYIPEYRGTCTMYDNTFGATNMKWDMDRTPTINVKHIINNRTGQVYPDNSIVLHETTKDGCCLVYATGISVTDGDVIRYIAELDAEL